MSDRKVQQSPVFQIVTVVHGDRTDGCGDEYTRPNANPHIGPVEGVKTIPDIAGHDEKIRINTLGQIGPVADSQSQEQITPELVLVVAGQ